MQYSLTEELFRGATVGQAFLEAKLRTRDSDFVRQYNLLGDPTVPIPAPALPIGLDLAGGLRPTVRGSVGGGKTKGEALVEWLGPGGEILDTATVSVSAGTFTASIGEGLDMEKVTRVRAYFRDVSSPRDGLGTLAIDGKKVQALYRNRIRWSTASEVKNYGFDVYTGETEEGPFRRLTEKPIAGGGTVDTPRSYEYVHAPTDPSRRYFYYVESISLDGERERFTPVQKVGPKLTP
jgi:hypothetical protein